MIPAHNTAEYVAAIEPTGDLALGLADMAILDALTSDVLASACPTIGRAALVFADCNLPAAMLADLIARRRGPPPLAGHRRCLGTQSHAPSDRPHRP